MLFHCPSCSLDTLELTRSLDLPPNDGFSDRAIQFLHCSVCDFSAAGFYHERSSPESEVDHFCFRIPSGSSAKKFQDLLASCQSPTQKDCSCSAHSFLDGSEAEVTQKIETEFHLDSVAMTLKPADGTENTDDLPDYLF